MATGQGSTAWCDTLSDDSGLGWQVFFMTAKALHLGFVHMIEDHKVAARTMGDHQNYVRDMQAMLAGCALDPT